MNKFRFSINALAVLTIALTFASLAKAQACRTWVSGVGDDANPCSRTAPCKTFAGAISKTAPGGEIDALDPGGFGAVTITKAMTIDGGGGQVASVLVSGTNGIVVQAGVNDVVTLANLRFQGGCNNTNLGFSAIKFNSGKGLNVINCYIWNFTTGIDITLGATGSFVFVSNTTVKHSTGDGLGATTSTGTVKVMIVESHFTENGTGLHAKANSRVTADHSTFSNNTNDGIFADGSGGVSVANATNSTIANNGTNGIEANASGIGRINNCDIFTNGGTGALVGAGEIDTWGNNRIFSNGTDGCPGCTGKGVS